MSVDGHIEGRSCPTEGGQTDGAQAHLGHHGADAKPDEPIDLLQLTWHITYHNHPSVDLPEWWASSRVVALWLLAFFLFSDVVSSFLLLPEWIGAFSFLGAYIVFVLWQSELMHERSGTQTDRRLDGSLSLSGRGNPRLECYGTRRELTDLRLDGQFREPFIASATLSRHWLWVFLLSWAVIEFVIGGMGTGGQAEVMLKTSIFLLTGSAILLAPRNLYYRVAPGRLDILRGGIGKTSLSCRRRIPLDCARIVCRFDQQKLCITQSDSVDGASDVIDLQRLPGPHAFVKAVFEAAVSPHPTPPLPDDALLG